VVWVTNVAPGATDREVLAWAAREQRVLITFDKDFGELARSGPLPPAWRHHVSDSDAAA
jgi:predicted nuclease of predicted toxin-antitoxin system